MQEVAMPEKKRGPRGPGRGPGHGSADVGFAALFKGLGNFVELLGDIVESGENTMERTGEFKPHGLGDKARGVYGVRVRVGLGGETSVEPFGNIRSSPKGPEVVDVREPLIDVFDEEDEVMIVAELPGASEEAIKVEIEGDVLSLTSSGARRYAKEVLLPCAVDAASLTRAYRNGVLELKVKKA
jgi:HSP20 family protein